MIIARCLFIFGFGLTLLLSGIHVGAAENLRISFDADSQEGIQKGIIDQQIRIMPQLNALNFGLGWFNNHNFYYEISDKSFLHNHKDSNNRSLVTLFVTDRHGTTPVQTSKEIYHRGYVGCPIDL